MFEGQEWYKYLEEPMQDLVDESYYLRDREQMHAQQLHDYSFVVFPIAKAYEGFLKKFLLEIKLISLDDFEGKYFRMGRSLNPSLPQNLRDNKWIYDNLKQMCQHKEEHEGKNLAVILWEGWKKGRNSVFHYFVGHQQFISLDEAGERVEMIRKAMQEAVRCKVLDTR